jgi:hypothetical protein
MGCLLIIVAFAVGGPVAGFVVIGAYIVADAVGSRR